MSVGIDLGSSTVKVVADSGASVDRYRPVDPELAARVGTSVPLVRPSSRGVTTELPHEAYVRELARALDGITGTAVTVVVPDWWSRHAHTMVERTLQARASVPVVLESAAVAAVRSAAGAQALPATVAVLDVGAESSSVAVVADTDTDPHVVGRPTVLTGRGGREFDRRLIRHTVDWLAATGHELAVDDAEAREIADKLAADLRNAKEQLSTRPSVSLSSAVTGSDTELRIVRSEFDEVVGDTVQAIVGMVRSSVANCDAAEPVGAVLLAGGGAAVPLLSQLISAELGLPVVLDDDPATLAVRGAAAREHVDPAPSRRMRFRKKDDFPHIIVFALDPVRTVAEPVAAVVVSSTTELEPESPVVVRRPAQEPLVDTTPTLTGRVLGVGTPVEIEVAPDSDSPLARMSARWVVHDLEDPPAPAPEGRIDAQGHVWFRINGEDHAVPVGAEHAGTQVTIVMLALHLLITATATGDLLREVRLDPDHGFAPEQ